MRLAGRHGFTLIEVLIAMTLLGVMVVLLFSCLRIAAESWNAGENKMASVNQKAVVYQFFKRHLTSIRPMPVMNSAQDAIPDGAQVFQGFAQNLTFVAGLPASSARKGLQIFNVVLDPAGAMVRVTLTPYRLTDADRAPDKPEVLLERVADLRFAYFGKIEEFDEPRWQQEWLVPDRLPSLIKVSIALQDGSYWPDMVFDLKISRAANAQILADEGLSNADADQQ
ncbi:prepilin-type N-terminal cleavage/methylation domain-containing protein [Methylomonas sp. SURF-2]|uniref:Prepilin-type N-terminal cleavage/methylation domain-containing protein n=1 Tax=Methylomonas subterranea TaxID=2952225 RepID=A0ABT1THU6_9GAMM|nr:prepilin-type N-terminal cleavage/methylation domain-containing protein [Methylomonas sp. SURF-2]